VRPQTSTPNLNLRPGPNALYSLGVHKYHKCPFLTGDRKGKSTNRGEVGTAKRKEEQKKWSSGWDRDSEHSHHSRRGSCITIILPWRVITPIITKEDCHTNRGWVLQQEEEWPVEVKHSQSTAEKVCWYTSQFAGSIVQWYYGWSKDFFKWFLIHVEMSNVST